MRTFRRLVKVGLYALFLLLGARFAPAAEIEPGLPAKTEAVVTINVKQLLHAPLLRQHGLALLRQVCNNTAAVREALEMLGFDPFRDVERLTLASLHEGEDQGCVVVLRGHFDTERFQKAARHFVQLHSDRVSIHKQDDLKYYAVAETGKHGSLLFGTGLNAKGAAVLNCQMKGCLLDAFAKTCVSLVDKNTLVAASSEELLKEACQHIKEGDSSALNKPMRRLLREVESKQAITVAWRANVARLETAWAADTSEIEEEPVFMPLREMTGSIALADDLQLRCTLRAAGIDDAREIMKGFEEVRLRADGLATLLAGSSKEYAFLKEIPRSFAAVRKGKIIVVEGRLSVEMLAKLLGPIGGK